MAARRARIKARSTARGISGPTPYQTDVEMVGSLREIVEEWGVSLEARAVSPRTHEVYRETALQLADFLEETGGPADFAWVKAEHIEAWLASLARAGRKPATLSVRYRALRQLFGWASGPDKRIIQHDPMASMRPPVVPETPLPLLTDDQLKALFRVLRTDRTFEGIRDNAIIRVMLDTGIRRAELLGIRFSDDPEANDVDIARGVIRVFGKGRKERLVYLGAKARVAIMAYRRHRARHKQAATADAFWITARGRLAPNGLYQLVRRRGRQAGIPNLHPHAFRHQFAHNWQVTEGREGDLMALAGWSSPAMVRRYAKSAQAERALDAARSRSLSDRF